MHLILFLQAWNERMKGNLRKSPVLHFNKSLSFPASGCKTNKCDNCRTMVWDIIRDKRIHNGWVRSLAPTDTDITASKCPHPDTRQISLNKESVLLTDWTNQGNWLEHISCSNWHKKLPKLLNLLYDCCKYWFLYKTCVLNILTAKYRSHICSFYIWQ